MTNYKPHAISYFGGVPMELPFGAKIVTMTAPLLPTTAGITFHATSGLTNYIIPAGKKFILIGITIFVPAGAARNLIIFSNDLIDSSATEVTMSVVSQISGVDNVYDIPLPNQDTTPQATKYINYRVDNASNPPIPLVLIGYEANI